MMTVKEPKPKKECVSCKKLKVYGDFFLSNSEFHKSDEGRFPVCKVCVKSSINIEDIESIKNVLIQLNRPYLAFAWKSSEEEVMKTGKDIFGTYYKNIILNYKELTWKDSVFTSPDISNTIIHNKDEEYHNEQTLNKNNYNINQLKSKYGYGYPDDEYYLFEDKYQQLKTSFQLLTTMHEEYFREFCVNKVKETLAKAKGNFKEAKEWAAMVKDVAEAGKLKPSQMSKSDLSGGLDTFGQLARMVEENHEIMPLLPHFIEQPKDKVDVTMWCFINYVRDLKGLPECEYKEIYEFYDKKKQDYESQMSDNSINKEDVDNG